MPEASGSDFPHIVLLDFAQDLTLGREVEGRSHPANMPITNGWSLSVHRQTTLPATTQSEIEATCEYKPTHPLPGPLARFQPLIDVEAGGLTQPVSGGCDDTQCEPGERCEECVNNMWVQCRAKSWIINSASGYDTQPFLSAEEAKPVITWRLTFAAQRGDTVTAQNQSAAVYTV